MKPHAFVAMPSGVKKDSQGNAIDFNRVYAELISPALESAGFEAFRADDEAGAADIRTELFQELRLADVLVADLTLATPNVWYELGVRHALRARGVVIVGGGAATTAFDRDTDHTLRYGIKDGGPDPATLQDDIRNLTDRVKATMEPWHGQHNDARDDRMLRAPKAGRIGDMLILADEAPVAAFRAEAWIKAGEALRKAERFDFALEQLERGLAIEPGNLNGLREKGVCLQQLALAGASGHRLERAREHYRKVLELYPDDPETWALLGRLGLDAWIAAWRQPGKTPQQMRNAAACEDALLRAAIDSYAQAYRCNPGHCDSGIKALTLMHLYRRLTGDAHYDREMSILAGAVRRRAAYKPDAVQLFGVLASLGDLEVLVGTPDTAKAAYQDAIASNDLDWFALNASRAQLQMLKDLGFRPEHVDAGIAILDRALQQLSRPEDKWQPRQVFLFSGHMTDTPDRATPRFPPAKESIAAQKIAEALDQLGAGPDDLALTQGACGGDLLFTEACLQRGVKVQWLQPFSEMDFIRKSVVRCGEAWRQRYLDAQARLAGPIRSAPDELGAPPSGTEPGYPYERCNLWLLYTALACGVDKVRFICLWNGEGGDGPGGTAHMYNEVKNRTGRAMWIDVRRI